MEGISPTRQDNPSSRADWCPQRTHLWFYWQQTSWPPHNNHQGGSGYAAITLKFGTIVENPSRTWMSLKWCYQRTFILLHQLHKRDN